MKKTVVFALLIAAALAGCHHKKPAATGGDMKGSDMGSAAGSGSDMGSAAGSGSAM